MRTLLGFSYVWHDHKESYFWKRVCVFIHMAYFNLIVEISKINLAGVKWWSYMFQYFGMGIVITNINVVPMFLIG